MRNKKYFISEPGAPLPLSAVVEHRVMLSEVDLLGIVWHGCYPRFFEEAHTALFRHCGLTYADYARAGLIAPIAKIQIDYRAPLRLDDLITIKAKLHYCESAKLQTAYEIIGANGRTACTGYTLQIFADATTGEPLYLSPEIWEECRRRWQRGDFYG